MRRPAFTVLGLLLLCPSLIAAAPHETTYHREVSTRNQSPRPWRRLSDAIVRKIWGLPDTQDSLGRTSDNTAAAQDAPANLVARYGDDIVLRFTIQTDGEASSLAEACRILFLDVWEFNEDWADIRIAKDVVS